MFSSVRSPNKTPLVSHYIKNVLEEQSPLLETIFNNSTKFLSTIDPLFSYVEIPLKKNTYSFLDSDKSIKSSDNLVALLWDATSPFTGEKIDTFSQKTKLLKEKLCIGQQSYDDFDLKRSSSAWNPMSGSNFESSFPPRVDKASFRDIGTYTHYSDRSSFDIGFLTYSSIPMTSLEHNKTWQNRLEKCWSGHNSELSEILELVKVDTNYSRIQALMQCYHEFFLELIRLEKDGKKFKNVYIILNPILNANDPTIKYVTSIAKDLTQRYMQKTKLGINVKIILISKVCSEDNSYVASESACKFADELVNIKKTYIYIL